MQRPSEHEVHELLRSMLGRSLTAADLSRLAGARGVRIAIEPSGKDTLDYHITLSLRATAERRAA